MVRERRCRAFRIIAVGYNPAFYLLLRSILYRLCATKTSFRCYRVNSTFSWLPYVCFSHLPVLSTRRHPAHPVSVLILRPMQTQALWSQNYDTEIPHRNAVKGVDNNAVKGIDNAMLCHRTGHNRDNTLAIKQVR